MRNFGIERTSGPALQGKEKPSRSHDGVHNHTPPSNLINFRPPGSLWIPSEPPLERSSVLQVLIDVGALVIWGVLSLVGAVAITASIFILLFFAT